MNVNNQKKKFSILIDGISFSSSLRLRWQKWSQCLIVNYCLKKKKGTFKQGSLRDAIEVKKNVFPLIISIHSSGKIIELLCNDANRCEIWFVVGGAVVE